MRRDEAHKALLEDAAGVRLDSDKQDDAMPRDLVPAQPANHWLDTTPGEKRLRDDGHVQTSIADLFAEAANGKSPRDLDWQGTLGRV